MDVPECKSGDPPEPANPGQGVDRGMNDDGFELTVLGTRGSMAVSGPDYALFGGATSCYMIRAGQETIFLDGGSGLACAQADFPHPPVIFLSHLHLDHLMGLGMYSRLSARGKQTDIVVPVREGEDPAALLDGLYSPPYWPLKLTQYAGDVRIVPLRLPVSVGDVLVEGLLGRHPGDCEIFRISWRGRSLVYMTDYEPGELTEEEAVAFAKGTDWLLYDGQYTEQEYPRKKGFGHSTAEGGLRFMRECGAGHLLIIHHDPLSSDEELLRREASLGLPEIRYARQGEVIRIDT